MKKKGMPKRRIDNMKLLVQLLLKKEHIDLLEKTFIAYEREKIGPVSFVHFK